MLNIHQYSEELPAQFEVKAEQIRRVLGEEAAIEHVGSSAVGIGGKNIIDILVGVKNIREAADKLIAAGYFEGNDSHDDRIFLASRQEETQAGDTHIHVCIKDSPVYCDFLTLRDYLRAYPEEAKAYEEHKHEFSEQAKHDRKQYKKLKSAYVSALLERARAATNK